MSSFLSRYWKSRSIASAVGARRLLRAKRHGGVGATRLHGGDPGSGDSRDGKHNGHRDEGRWIRRGDVVEQSRQPAGGDDGDADADRQSRRDQREPVPNDDPPDAAHRRAESDADPHLTSATARDLAEDTVDADHREEQPDRGENDE